MADYNSGLPIRSEADGTDEKVHVKIKGNPTGVGAATNEAIVDNDKNLHEETHGNKPDGSDVVALMSEEGFQNSNGDYNAVTNTRPSSQALILHDRVAAPAEADQNFRPTGVASSDGSNAKAMDVALRDESGNAFTTSNPLPVTLVDSEGSEINDYNASSGTVAAATANHDYTVTALKTLKAAQISCSASGKAKFQVMVETGVATGIFTTKFVKFNSTANPNCDFDIKELITVAAGVKIRVAKTNLDNQAQDLYSTISGHEIP